MNISWLQTISVAAAIFAAGLNAIAGPASAQTTSIYTATLGETNQKTQELNTETLRRILADGSAIVLDTRSKLEFDAGHIPGARNLDAPPPTYVAAVEKLVQGDKGKFLVLYCNGPYCQASRRVADQLVAAGFTNVRRYQLGMPIWRALGGPTQIELGGIKRIFGLDQTAVFIDARPAEQFNRGSLAGARNFPAEEIAAGKTKVNPLPEDDFNRRIVLFGGDGMDAYKLAVALSTKPWHNVSYFGGSFQELAAAVNTK
jgi:rhodanese-related sulfurtransferase